MIPRGHFYLEVKGYALSACSAALKQLNEDLADNVSDATEQGQAENRRVVVRTLQNKAIAGV